ncbi:MAG: GIY-YIG nuclease family protein [Minisyncoccia bacterium]
MNSLPKNIPKKPGVYLFLDKKEKVLYVGRAVNLKRRVSNYFENNLEPRIREMVRLAKKIKIQITDNLLEAIILEANLIKKYWPKYNVREKDNRSFIYIVIPKQDFTKPIIVRGREIKKFPPQKADVFGPYKSISLLTTALRIIRRIFPYSTCQIGSGRPCFDYQIGLCPGACIGAISKEDYQKNIDNIILLLKGQKKALFKRLERENPAKILALKHLEDVALLSKDDYYLTPPMQRIEGYDISHLSGKETYGSMVVFEDSKPNPQAYRLFKIKEAAPNNDLASLEETLTRRFRHQEWHYPDLIVIDGGKPQIDYLTKVFAKHNVSIPFLGISKYQNDKLVFPKNTSSFFKHSAEEIKNTLLQVREEAHRFAIMAGRRKRIKNMLK